MPSTSHHRYPIRRFVAGPQPKITASTVRQPALFHVSEYENRGWAMWAVAGGVLLLVIIAIALLCGLYLRDSNAFPYLKTDYPSTEFFLTPIYFGRPMCAPGSGLLRCRRGSVRHDLGRFGFRCNDYLMRWKTCNTARVRVDWDTVLKDRHGHKSCVGFVFVETIELRQNRSCCDRQFENSY